jgi:hypothetical protein
MKEGAKDSEAQDDELDDVNVNHGADILSLAGELLEIMNRHRHTCSIELGDARIGISLGNAVPDVLGEAHFCAPQDCHSMQPWNFILKNSKRQSPFIIIQHGMRNLSFMSTTQQMTW